MDDWKNLASATIWLRGIPKPNPVELRQVQHQISVSPVSPTMVIVEYVFREDDGTVHIFPRESVARLTLIESKLDVN